MRIDDAAVLITGGSQGLGEALAHELASRKARVVLVARGEALVHQTVDAIRRAGGEAHAIVADVGRKEDAHRIAGIAAALVGPIDLLVHNASTLGPVPLRLLLDTECEDLADVLEVNLVGPFRVSRAVIGSMLLRERGVVVQVSSDAATNAYPRWGAYGVSKAASDHLVRTWAAELLGTGVRVFSVDPGEMDTAMHAAALPEADRASLAQPREVARRLADFLARSQDVVSGSRLDLSHEVGS
jgi:NAD(P)-dependent dehydrogenase (short-subunit alcohol dehydrogenase family)